MAIDPSSIIKIYKVLYKYSDIDHPLTQQQIIDYLDKDYNLVMERRAIGRNIGVLNSDLDIEIQHDSSKGYYLMDREFEPSELRLLIDSVLGSKHIDSRAASDLIQKLLKFGTVSFKNRISNISSIDTWNRTESRELFFNIDEIDDAINEKCQIKFKYMKYLPSKKLGVSSINTISPYQMLIHNQHYYLYAYNEEHGDHVFYRIDKMADVTLLHDKLRTPAKAHIDYKKIATELPYLFIKEPQKIKMRVDKKIIDDIVDWFGKEFKVIDNESTANDVVITLYASPQAMEYWALQYGKSVEILEPQSLRKTVYNDLHSILDKYEGKDKKQ